MTTAAQDSRKIIDFLYNFENIVRKENWAPRYDKDADSLSFTVPELSNTARISYLDDEIAFYFNKDKEIEGIFIEYFTSNFIKHHKELKKITKDIEKKYREDESLIKIKTFKDKNILSKFEEILKSSLLDNVQFQKVGRV